MAEKPRKSRPNRKADALSDARSRNVLEASRTIGYARTSPADPADGLAVQARDLRAAGAVKVFRQGQIERNHDLSSTSFLGLAPFPFVDQEMLECDEQIRSKPAFLPAHSFQITAAY